MILFKKGAEMAGWAQQQRAAGRQIGFVPTMGALHPGHISLIDLAKNRVPLTVCSIFVNPTQFNDPKDFEKYPITIENDIYLLEAAGVDALFLPEVAEMYPGGLKDLEKYDLGRLETLWEGEFRPGHFQGVCQVVRRLLDHVHPHQIFMGQKDYQQCLVIRRLLALTGSAAILTTCPIVREPDGLAMSSRNQRLTPGEREKAPAIHRALSWLAANWKEGVKDTDLTPVGERPAHAKESPAHAKDILAHAQDMLVGSGLRPDYITVADAGSLEPLYDHAGNEPKDRSHPARRPHSARATRSPGAVALAAAFLGDVRLIDNMLLGGKE